MRTNLPEKLENGRLRTGELASESSWGPYGAFFVFGPCGQELKIIASGAEEPTSAGWEHVSVSTNRRPPNWQENGLCEGLVLGAGRMRASVSPASLRIRR